ncbi:MAG: shikimate kinase AroK [Phycisphaerales bacterium]|nr:shikimate kinase AroK [Phycisphaerales bacterium]
MPAARLPAISRLFLIGPMGAGKTTVGRRLAQVLNLEFIDSDQEIVKRAGANIPLIFELEGEQGFRAREKAIIDEVTQRSEIVLATGGGTVLDPDNRSWLRERGFVIYLWATVDEQLQRTRLDSNRPLLQTANPRERLAQLFEQRDPLYRATADLMIQSDGQAVRKLVGRIIDTLSQQDAY